MRDLTAPAQGRAIRELLQSLFVAEVLAPSEPLWLLSGWISDIPVIDNRSGDFSGLAPQWSMAPVSLSAVLKAIVDQRGTVNVVLRDVPHNYGFVERLRRIQENWPKRMRIALSPDFHKKALVGRDYELAGSMNFTHRGLGVNDENLIFRTDLATVRERRLSLEQSWQGWFDDSA